MTSDTIPASINRPLPAPGNALWLAHGYNRRLASSIVKLAELSPDTDSQLREHVQVLAGHIDPTRRLRRSVYTGYFTALDQYRKRGSIESSCLKMLSYVLENAHCDQRMIVNMRRQGWIEREVIVPNENAARSNVLRVRFNEADQDTFVRAAQIADEAVLRLSEADKGLNEEIAIFLSRLYLFQGAGVVGLTSPRFHGAMLISTSFSGSGDEQLAYFMEHVIHELSHMYLNTILSFDRLVENDASERFDAPIRPDKRPLLGIYHSTFVLVRIVLILEKIACNDRSGLGAALERIMDDRRARLEKGINTLAVHARLTPLGARLFDSIRACV